MCGTFFPPTGGVLSPTLKSVRTLLWWQTQFSIGNPKFDSFTIFLTTHVEGGKVNEAALEQMVAMIEANQAQFPEFANALEKRFGINDAQDLADSWFPSFYSIALPKIVVSEAFDLGWSSTPLFAGQYKRTRATLQGDAVGTYSMLALVVRFDRHRREELKLGSSHVPRTREYGSTIKELTHETRNIDKETSGAYDKTASDLEQVVAYREAYRKQMKAGR